MKPIEYNADLHNHTTASDGALTPEQLVFLARKMGIRTLGITDHDTIGGLHEAIEASHNVSVDILAGVEITVRFMESFFKGSLHILAYFDQDLLDNTEFVQDTSDALSKGRGDALTQTRIESVNACFGPYGHQPLLPRDLTGEDVYAFGHQISRRHFALALNSLGLEDRATVSRIIGNESPAYVPSGSPLSDLQPYLGRWPLALFLAHPAAGSYPGDSIYREVLPPFEIVERLMPEFIRAGIIGLEIEYPGHTREWKQKLRDYMKTKSLVYETGGSDCHDETSRPLGMAGVSREHVEAIRRHCRLHVNKPEDKRSGRD